MEQMWHRMRRAASQDGARSATVPSADAYVLAVQEQQEIWEDFMKFHGKWITAGIVLASIAIGATSATAQRKYDPGASDAEIKIGQTMPYSGPASAYAAVGKVEVAYFKMINERGGIRGRKITLLSYDDGYNPAKTVEQVRRLVESDQVLLTFQSLGTPTNAAVQNYLNAKKVPHLFLSTGATRFTDPQHFPWSMGYNLNYRTEGRLYARYILDNYPNAKIGALYQNDDYGRDYLMGLREGLGSKAATMIVAEALYEVTDPTISSQMVNLRAAGADLLYDATIAKFATQAIKKAAEMSWKPVHILAFGSTSIGGTLAPAGLENAKGIVSVRYGKDPTDPTWNDDPDTKKWRAFMDKYYPEGDKSDGANGYGYAAAQLMVKVLEMCGDELTRENVMKQATNLKDVVLDFALPGISINTTPTDYRVFKQVQMARFDGERWVLFRPIFAAE
jgi:branched-chain amino acid transport system substrate-binding protein